MRRRTFLQTSIAALGGLLLAGCADDAAGEAPSRDGGPWLMPEEGTPHARTWLAFGASDRIWGADLVPTVQRDLALIATTIARFEPVSMLVPPAQMALAQRLVSGSRVELVACELDDLWIRDTGPTFVKNGPTKAGVDFNFNGWGSKQRSRRDRAVARVVGGRAGAPALRTDLVLEGGALEVDGEGTAIITESCVLNDNRNRGWTKAEVEDELRELLGIRKVIWLPGIAGEDITDGHTDFYARFARPGVVVAGLETDRESFDYDVTRKHLEILRAATDVHGNRLRVEVMESPSSVREEFASDDFAGGYINFYVCNGAVIGPEFGAADTDAAARATMQRLFPDRRIVQINIDGIAAGGGGIHCTTQQEPA